MWECLHCGEEVEEVFEVCWKCQARRDGLPSELPDPVRDEDEEEQLAALDRRYAPRDCLRCRGALKFDGTWEFSEGDNWGGLGKMFVRRLPLDVYVCPTCLHVEFFAADTHL
jgi:hypothetical protein